MGPPLPKLKPLAELLDAAKAPENRGIVCGLAAAAAAVAGLALLYTKSRAPPKKGRFADGSPLADDEYLAVIVGAGPSGSACGYYLASKGHKVALLDKARFPRGALRAVFRRENEGGPPPPSLSPARRSTPFCSSCWPPARLARNPS